MSAKRVPVDWVTLTLAPIAHCEDCDWRPLIRVNTVTDARAHARSNPGHHAVVSRVKRSEYFVREVGL